MVFSCYIIGVLNLYLRMCVFIYESVKCLMLEMYG